MPAYFQRPENALKRANEFLEVDKKQPALDVLYDVIKSKKHRTWQKIHEPIMLKYLELCVDLRKSHLAKEGLYQYKNICQQVNIKSLEDVVRAYLKLAEEKTETAKGESQQMVLDIEDLDNIQTPESVLLSAVSGEDTQDRTDRLLLTPWVKFLWESYRQCLDLLRNNSKVERLYHDIAQQAFKFCLQYTRKAEFRKLCDNLRMHLGQIQRHHNQSTAINLNNPESQSMHLETRLVQLDSAISMELWQEAFKAVEDIHGLFALSKKPPKPQLMANYYNKVSTVFWKSGNALFHASTLHRLYHLSREMRKNLTQEEMQRMSTRVLLATLSIPITPERTDIARLLDMDGIIVEKHRRLATLLGLQSPPTRQSLINDMVRYNLLQYVVPDVKELYNWLEVEFHPLKLCDRVTKVLNWVRDQAEKDSDLQHYVPHLQGNTILRLLQQVAQIYQSIEFSRLASLVPFVDAFQLERSIVDAARHCDLQVRIDHTSHTLSFGSDLNYSAKEDSPVGPFLQNMPSEQIRNQLTAMSSALAKAIDVIKPAVILQEREDQKQLAIAAYLKNSRKEHQRVLARRQTIEERKERLENLNIQREKEELEQREAELQKVRKAEEERLRLEAKEREKERIMQEHEQIKKKTVRERLEQIKKTELGAKAFKDIDIEDLEELDPDFIMAKQVQQLEKEKKELQERLKNQEKKIDYFERAKRLEEIPLIKKAYEEQRVKDMELWELQEEERISNMQVEREKALEHKQRLSRMMEDKDNFVSKITAARQSVYEEKLKQFQERFVEERKQRLEDRKKQRKEDRRNMYYRDKEEEEQRLHEEQLKREREERERVELEQREEEEREYQEKLRKLEEQERKQRARQLEIEERERRREEEKRVPEDKPLSRDSNPRWADREEGGGGGGGGWRKRTDGGESEWRRPGTGTDNREEGREDEKPAFRRDDDREPPFRRGGDDRGPRRGFEDERGPRRGFDEDRAPRRGLDDDRGPRRGFDEDRAPRRGADEDRGPRKGADEDWGPRRGGDDDRGPRRGGRGMDDDQGPRHGVDSKPWKPLGKTVTSKWSEESPSEPVVKLGGWREREKAREESWAPPRDMGGSEESDEREPDRERRPPREEGSSAWRRGGTEESSGWRDSPRSDAWEDRRSNRRDDHDRRDVRDKPDERDRRGPPRAERGEVPSKWKADETSENNERPASSWRRGGEERKEERDTPRRGAPPSREKERERPAGEGSVWRAEKERERPAGEGSAWRAQKERERPAEKERERPAGEDSAWRADKDKEASRRAKMETDDDGWTTVRR
ncbi:eukaryotic translation initiation factor 3 subunit A isoform X1 [Acipenser oxyrinchus oxyrinchus]|uniref:Eukaryotic translation initiation factor 3 subunit A n=1 Tax=Acipenser oxyrinchus oxyrinchus TaxID=40147 RepID=A0AAD8D8H7_ACIOX|nr:eukaryotic translation initiation factor 3 subunit A isoform X1 [Acipenser oxyrinchus oxyrinchus]